MNKNLFEFKLSSSLKNEMDYITNNKSISLHLTFILISTKCSYLLSCKVSAT